VQFKGKMAEVDVFAVDPTKALSAWL